MRPDFRPVPGNNRRSTVLLTYPQGDYGAPSVRLELDLRLMVFEAFSVVLQERWDRVDVVADAPVEVDLHAADQLVIYVNAGIRHQERAVPGAKKWLFISEPILKGVLYGQRNPVLAHRRELVLKDTEPELVLASCSLSESEIVSALSALRVSTSRIVRVDWYAQRRLIAEVVGWRWLAEAFFYLPLSAWTRTAASLFFWTQPWNHNIRPSAGVQATLLAVLLNRRIGEVHVHGVSSGKWSPGGSFFGPDGPEKRFHLPADFRILGRLGRRGLVHDRSEAQPAD